LKTLPHLSLILGGLNGVSNMSSSWLAVSASEHINAGHPGN
jgi:hypothetical protein